MVSINNGQAPTGYHWEQQGTQRILVNDRTGNVALINPNTNQITGEVPRNQMPSGPGYPNAPVATPSQPGTYNPAGAGANTSVSSGPPSSPSGGGPPNVTPRAAGQLSGNVQPRTSPPGAPAAQPQTSGYDHPGTDTYDWWKINDALRAAQMPVDDGTWQIAGTNHTPTAPGKYVKNPDYDAQTNNEQDGVQPFIVQGGDDYQIGVVNTKTGQLVKLHMTKSAPGADGQYNYNITGRDVGGKVDNANPGYTGVQQLPFADGHVELWGTNSGTGAFEKMSGSPEGLGKLQGWNDVKQIQQGGKLVWVGTNPQGQPLQPIPGAPEVPVDRYVPGSVKQVQKDGKLVYVGLNSQTQQPEEIPGYGSEPVQQKPTTIGHNVYVTDPNGQLVPATGIAQPKEGDVQWVDASGGYAKQQTFHNGDWHDDDIPQKAVNPATQRALGALKQKGEKYWLPLPGSADTMIQVTADGNGGYTYETGPNGEPPAVKKIPGIREPEPVTGAGTGEFLPQRRDPTTQQLLPPERNINWQPTNISDRIRQLQGYATQKQQDLHGQVVSGVLTEDQANQQFQDWWKDNIQPAKDEINLAQQYKQEDQARQNLTVAQDAGRAALTAAAGEHRAGPGYADALANIQQSFASGKFPQAMSADQIRNAVEYQEPNWGDIYDQATARALAHISPTAAQKVTGQPIPTGLGAAQSANIADQLDMTRYTQGGMPAGSINPVNRDPGFTQLPPGGITPVNRDPGFTQAPGGITPVNRDPYFDYSAWQQRQAQDAAAQVAQRSVQMPNAPLNPQPYSPGLYTSAFQAANPAPPVGSPATTLGMPPAPAPAQPFTPVPWYIPSPYQFQS